MTEQLVSILKARHYKMQMQMQMRKPLDMICIFLPLYALILWSISLGGVHIENMNDLGLVSVLPPLTLIALLIMIISFCLALRHARTPIILLHFVLLIVMLYGITTLVESEPRFHIVYRHAGYTEYIMRTGTVDPYLDAYFDWPGFFIWTALLTKAAGYHDILSYAAWAPVFLNLAYLGPIYIIFTSAITDKRVVWLGLWFFYLTNWIGQDYYSPQGLDFFMYLVIIAILLKWFKIPSSAQPLIRERHEVRRKRPPLLRRFYAWLNTIEERPSTPTSVVQRCVLLACLLILFAFVVFSHPLTPFFIMTSVTALVIFRRCYPFWLPIVMALITAGWIIFMTQPFLQGHMDWVVGDMGQLKTIFSGTVTEHVVGDAQHVLVTRLCIIMTFFVWVLACLGAIGRWQHGYRDITIALLAFVPFPLLAVQPYGGEMLLRVYLFTLPPMTLFAASLLYTVINKKMSRTSPWMTVMITMTCILLLSGFLFTRYGNEHMDYMTPGEVAGVHHLYNIATPESLFLEGSDGTPWQLQDFEKYDMYALTDVLPIHTIAAGDAHAVVQFIEDKMQAKKYSNVYLIFTRSQKATANADYSLPPDTLDQLEDELLASGNFRLVYRTPDAQILLFIAEEKGGPR